MPYDLAPSFRGQFARYSYKLTIGFQKLNGSTQMLRLPFRVYSLMGIVIYFLGQFIQIYLKDFDKYIPSMANLEGEYDYTDKNELIVAPSSDLESLGSSCELFNPFKIEEKNGYEELEYAMQVLEDLTARMNVSK